MPVASPPPRRPHPLLLIPKLKKRKRGGDAAESARTTPLPGPSEPTDDEESPRPSHLDDDLRKPVSGRDHIRGDRASQVTIVIYADFECEPSTAAATALRELQDDCEVSIRVAFRHLPNPGKHGGSVDAALAAEAAGDQGCFWEMHDLLFEAAESLDLDGLTDLAGRLGLDAGRFRKAVAEELFAERLENDVDSAMRSNVDSTPAIFIDGKRHRGGHGQEALREAVTEAAAP